MRQTDADMHDEYREALLRSVAVNVPKY